MKKLRNKNEKGFTLIELLVVIAIIGLLASVVLLALNSARAKSRDAKRLADVRQLASAYELFFNDFYGYPTQTGAVTTGGKLSAAPFVTNNTAFAQLVPNYIGLAPVAPAPADGSCLSPATAQGGGNDYYMYNNSSGNTQALTATYAITFCLGAQTGGYPAGPHTLTPAGIQ